MRAAVIASCILLAVQSPAALAAPPDKGLKDETDPTANRITGAETYVPTFGLLASITRGVTVKGTLTVDAGLDVPDPKVRKRAEAIRPRLFSEMRQSVLLYAELSYIFGNSPDVDLLRSRMQKAVDGVLGPGTSKVVLASVIVMPR